MDDLDPDMPPFEEDTLQTLAKKFDGMNGKILLKRIERNRSNFENLRFLLVSVLLKICIWYDDC